jgi:hypothetical protein
MMTSIYNAQISAGSLLIPESRKVAEVLLQARDQPPDWQRLIQIDNILQKRSPSSAWRQLRLLRNRLEPAAPELLQIIAHADNAAAIQVLLALTIRHSHLLGDFLQQVVKEHARHFETHLSAYDWPKFLAECALQAPEINKWSDSTHKKLGQVIYRILAEAKYIDGTRTLRLLPVRLLPQVQQCLAQCGETYALNCMLLTS